MRPVKEIIKEKPIVGWMLFFATVVVVFLIGLLASSIMERRTEAVFAYAPALEFEGWETRNEEWGKYFPRQYESLIETKDTSFRSKYNGSATIDMLEEDPRLVVLWAGYGFSKDYNQSRGHYYAVEDIRKTLRTGAPMGDKNSPMPNTCWTCKSPDVPRLIDELGSPEEFYKGHWEEHGDQVVNAIGCADCHDPNTMQLVITRPALIEAFENQGKDIEDATHQQMRSLVCAQCHVEYYFNKNIVDGVPYLKFPWDNGLNVDAAEKYYDNMDFADWTHPMSKAPMLKAQHPGYELYQTSVHAKRGVSCADCHMPYKSEGGQKFTDHHIQSPLNNVANSCQVCHRQETQELISDVYERQDKIIMNRDELEKQLVSAHVEAQKAWELGATEEQMEDILMHIRHAQWRWDYAAASHGAAFHAPIETGRIISTGMTRVQEARIKLARVLAELGHNEPVPYPDISTKEKAQEFVGLNMEKLQREKQEFLETVVPQWIEQAEERHARWDKKGM